MNGPADEFGSRLLAAIEGHDFDDIIALVRLGASPDWARGCGETLLIHAVSQGQGGLADALAEAGASLDLADASGDTPLIHAARHNMDGIVEGLLSRGADPLKLNLRGESAGDAARMGSKSLALSLRDDTVEVEQIQHSFSRYERIVLRLVEAEAGARQCRAIAQCHEGLTEPLPVTPPLRLRKPGGP